MLLQFLKIKSFNVSLVLLKFIFNSLENQVLFYKKNSRKFIDTILMERLLVDRAKDLFK